MDATQITALVGAIGAVLAFLTTVAGWINANFKEKRARIWALEDKAELAKTANDTLERVKAETIEHFKATQKVLDEIQAKALERGQMIIGKIEENTTVSKEAFKEANGVNAKLLNLGVQLVDDKPKAVVVVNPEPIEVHQTSKQP